MWLGEARAPEGMRLYAIGDVHGCDDLLAEAHGKIADDLTARPIPDHRIVHIGDYIDRGPHSAAVIERLAGMAAANPRAMLLRGNHEDLLAAFLHDPGNSGANWLMNGGEATLASYGVAVRVSDFGALAEALRAKMPERHRAFLAELRLSIRLGDFFFCHAGVRPGVPLDAQNAEDLIWIREPFLASGRDFGAVVVHGHTPSSQPEVRSNRINIDTGAVYGGRLTVLVLEENTHRFL